MSDTELEMRRDQFYLKNQGKCVTCKYYRCRTTKHNGKIYRLEWCENENTENYKQTLENIYTCNDWS